MPAAKGVTFRSIRVRPASASEIAGQRADINASLALSQITSEASTRASETLALAQTSTLLKAQLAGTEASGLQTSIATADSKATAAASAAAAAASQTSSMSAQLGTLGITVATHQSALGTLDGRTKGFWRVSFNGGQPILSAYYVDDNGQVQQGVVIGGNLYVQGDALITGTVRSRVFMTDQGVDLAALVPGQFNWRGAGGGGVSGSIPKNGPVSGPYGVTSGFKMAGHRAGGTIGVTYRSGAGSPNAQNGDPIYTYVEVFLAYNRGAGWQYVGPVATDQLRGGAGQVMARKAAADAARVNAAKVPLRELVETEEFEAILARRSRCVLPLRPARHSSRTWTGSSSA